MKELVYHEFSNVLNLGTDCKQNSKPLLRILSETEELYTLYREGYHMYCRGSYVKCYNRIPMKHIQEGIAEKSPEETPIAHDQRVL